jgi:hypothetical protein
MAITTKTRIIRTEGMAKGFERKRVRKRDFPVSEIP